MAPMGIRLSPFGVAVFCLLAFGILYHLYAGVISSRLAAFSQRRNIDLRELLAVSVEAAVLGGKEVKKVRDENNLKEKSKGKTKEGAVELLTMGDLLSHRKMYNLVKNTFPEIKVNSEEHDSTVDNTALWSRDIPADILEKIEGHKEVPAESVTVWIDPLDATQEYTESLVKYVTTMVCVAVNGNRSSVSYTGHSPASPVKSFVHDAFGNGTTIIEAGGAGYKVLSLLQMPSADKEPVDQADVYVHVTMIKKWDICAGAALLSAHGGHMTTLKGEEIDYSGTPINKGGLVATVGVDHQAILQRLPNWDPEKQ